MKENEKKKRKLWRYKTAKVKIIFREYEGMGYIGLGGKKKGWEAKGTAFLELEVLYYFGNKSQYVHLSKPLCVSRRMQSFSFCKKRNKVLYSWS